jgi:serine/threonine protein kinase
MDEEEKPPQAETSDKTVIAPAPTEKPQAGPARTRTAERKLQPSPEPQAAPARTRTLERKLNLPLEAQAQPAPARTRTLERKLNLPPEAQAQPVAAAAPARTRTVERKLNLPPEAQAQPVPARTRTSELRAVTKGAAVAKPAVQKDEDDQGVITSPTALPKTDSVPQLGEDSPPTSLSTLPGEPLRSRPADEPDTLKEAPLHTLPGAPLEQDAPAAPVERTVMVRYPEAPAPAKPAAAAKASPSKEPVTAKELPAAKEPVTAKELPAAKPAPAAKEPPAAKPAAAAKAPPSKEPVTAKELPAAEPSSSAGVAPTGTEPPTAEAEALPPTHRRAGLSGMTLPPAGRTQMSLGAEEEEEEQPQASNEVALLVPGTKLGGYQLIERIGAGAMGTVWLARQLSLDRDVAVKVLRPGFAGDPLFVYRFTQEAFAAAQLIHHNIVQVYDCGSDKQIHFFSMEYVDAQSLQNLMKRGGPLDPEVAAGYVLQAARGLKFAHDRGMVHRDIKPDNLLINHNGVVKVADLGLVKLKRPSRAQTGPVTYIGKNPQEYAMGTPAYMAPEQVENSAKVDARADIYALGCTLYHLITGRPPFIADTIARVMDMHVREQPVPPDARVQRVPKVLSEIVMRMMAKRLDERFQDMGDVIKTLEAFLGIEATNTFSPQEEHANLLESCVKEYNQSVWAKRRRLLVLGLTVLAAAGTALADRFLGPRAGLAVAAFTAFTWMASFIMRGLLEKGSLFLRFRQFVFQAPLVTWLIWLLMLGGAGYGLYYLKLLIPTAALMGGALVFAVGFYLLVDRNVEIERKPPVLQVEQMLRSMRLRGLEEGALRQFVCKYSGENWEGFFEALFGYDAKITARRKWGLNERGLPRQQHSTWRDPLMRAMEYMQTARQRRRERRQLKMLESKKIKAQTRSTPAIAPE